MTALPVFGGALKREIVKRAYGMCGQASYEFELDPEEMTAGVQALNDAMAMLPAVPYNFPATGDGNAADESGLSGPDVLGASVMVARLIAPTIGKTLAIGVAQATAERGMIARYTPTPSMPLGRNTVRGAGNRFSSWFGPFFSETTPPTEIDQ